MQSLQVVSEDEKAVWLIDYWCNREVRVLIQMPFSRHWIMHNEPIGFMTWDPRQRPEYVEIGHNGIGTKYKGNGYGHAQLEEAIRRIKEYDKLKRIIVWTNSNFVAPKNYDSLGLHGKRNTVKNQNRRTTVWMTVEK